MNGLKVFENNEFGKVRCVVINNEVWFIGKDIAEILQYSNTRKAIIDHVDDEDKGVTKCDTLKGAQNLTIINESGMFSLVLGSKLPAAKKFKHWITKDVLPTIRKTGGYINNDEVFINTYLPFANDQTKLLFKTTLETVRKQNEENSRLKTEIKTKDKVIEHKSEIICGLTDDVDIYTKRTIINRVCRKKGEGYANRYNEMYKCFKETYHIDIQARMEGYNMKQAKKKDKLSAIGYAEKFGHIDGLYKCCVKLYETDVKKILLELNKLQ